jgi:hypothetical protein
MLHLYSLLLLLISLFAFPCQSAPNELKLRQPQGRLGIADFMTMIPGVKQKDVCELCKKILKGTKTEWLANAHTDQNQLNMLLAVGFLGIFKGNVENLLERLPMVGRLGWPIRATGVGRHFVPGDR